MSTSTPTYDALITATAQGADAYAWEVPDGWQQGRGAFGGLVTGALVRALEVSLDDPTRALRSLTATLCGPVLPGRAHVKVETLRGGTGVTSLAARIEQGDEVQAHAVGIFGRHRVADGDWLDRPAPDMPDWRDMPIAPIAPPLGPAFARHMRYRIAGAPPLGGSAGTRHASGWVQAASPGAPRDAAYLAALIDAWWPTAYQTITAPRPMATLAYTLELIGDWEGLDPDAPLFYQATSWAARGGYMVEFRELWGEDGRLMALNQQTIALIR